MRTTTHLYQNPRIDDGWCTVEIHGMESITNLMFSEDWRERLIAEYAQLSYRLDKLICYINDNDVSEEHDFIAQYSAMKDYRYCLSERLKKEKIHVILLEREK